MSRQSSSIQSKYKSLGVLVFLACNILLIFHNNQSTIKSTISNSNPTLLWMQQKFPLSSTLRTQMQMHQSNVWFCQTAKPIRQVLNPNVDDQFSNQLKSTPKVEAKRKCERQLQDEPRCLQKSQCCELLNLEEILQWKMNRRATTSGRIKMSWRISMLEVSYSWGNLEETLQ